MPRILFIYSYPSSFVMQDKEMLQRHFDVIPHQTKSKKGAGKEFLMWLWKHRKEYDITFAWFGDIFAHLSVKASRYTRKRTIVVGGGYDLTHIPELDYGLLSSPEQIKQAKYTFGRATRVVVSEDNLRVLIKDNLGLNTEHVTPVCLGFDGDYWKPAGEKKDIVITTSMTRNMNRARLKGLDTFIETAKLLPNIRFVIVGVDDGFKEELASGAPDNLTIEGFLEKAELIKRYQGAKVYCQLSRSESFGAALAEAMLCGCVPVGTKVGGIPRVIGKTGFYCPVKDAKAAAESIRKALASGKGKEARQRVLSEFPLERRESALVNIINELAGGG